MQFIRTAMWVILAMAIALFTKANWDIAPTYSGRVPVKLIGDVILEVRLPLLIVGAFLIGLVPMWALARMNRWRIQRRLNVAEQTLSAYTGAVTPARGDVDTAAPGTLPTDESFKAEAAPVPFDDETRTPPESGRAV